MKKAAFLLLFVFYINTLFAQPGFTALKIVPAQPKQNTALSFEYNQAYSSLIRKGNVTAAVYLFSKNGPKVLEPELLKKESVYTGTVTLDSTTDAIAFLFSVKDEKDMNGGKGYVVPVYAGNNEPLKSYHAAAANIYGSGMGEYLLGISNNSAKALEMMSGALEKDPSLRNEEGFLPVYLNFISREKKKEAKPFILKELEFMQARPSISEADYQNISFWYKQIKMKAEADSFTAIMKTKYPEGEWRRGDIFNAFNTEKNADKKKALVDEYLQKFPLNDKNKGTVEFLQQQVANAYAKEKNWAVFMDYTKNFSAAARASLYNNVSWNMAEAKEDLNEAKKMSGEATAWAKKEIKTPTEKKPDMLTKEKWAEQRKSTYGMYGDTYGFILYQLGDYKTGYAYAKEAAEINKLKDPEYNERYALLAEKVLPAAESKKLIEGFVKEGKASSKTKELLKGMYIKEKGSGKGYEDYLAKMENDAKIKRRAEIAKTIINEPAPKFSLKDFEGKTVSLDELKDKVVVVDFWATWCGPCIASMPGMKKAQDKYKSNDRVKFLFVDTWESAEDKLKNAKEFMEKKGYDFHVLMDTEDKVVSDFSVNGIPTKFIIDGKGNVRFKSVGFGGNDDALVDELSTMIEMAGK
ncbi:MAG: TlpA disulfide reductase family protein [Ferruginibacter sp.]